MATEQTIYRSETEARGAITPGIGRYMLGFSLGLAIIAMIVVYFIFFH